MIVVAICMALCLLPCSKASRKLLEEDWQGMGRFFHNDGLCIRQRFEKQF